MLKDLDISSIKEDFDKVLCYSQGLTKVKTNIFFENWMKNKETFYKAFGEKLIYTDGKLKTFHLSEQEKTHKLEKFIWEIDDNGYGQLADFLRFNFAYFFENILPEDYTFTDQINLIGEKITIPKGIKIIKAFKFFITDKNVLCYYQDYASRIIQEDKIEGYLCFSIHPLDFLSTSENIYKWRSCHALDGEYRAGNLSYMQDNSTIICYLVSHLEEKHKLPSFPNDVLWNSKKWRRLLFFSNDRTMSFAGRPYPFEINGSLEEISSSEVYDNINRFNSDLRKTNAAWSKWTDNAIKSIPIKLSDGTEEDVYLDKTYYLVGRKLISNKKLIKDAENSTHYNDLLFSSCYVPFYCSVISSCWGEYYLSNSMANSSTVFEIGAPVPCLVCGDSYVDRCEDTILCSNCCENIEDNCDYCGLCGRAIREHEDYYWVGDELICEDCYERHEMDITTCDICGIAMWKDNALHHRDTNGNEITHCHYCHPENTLEAALPNADFDLTSLWTNTSERTYTATSDAQSFNSELNNFLREIQIQNINNLTQGRSEPTNNGQRR